MGIGQMNWKRQRTRHFGLERVLWQGGLIAQVLLSVVVMASTVSAGPTSFSSVQTLPTRPPDSSPTREPSTPPPPSPEPRDTSSEPVPTPPGISPLATEVTATEDLASDASLTAGIDLTFADLGYDHRTLSNTGATASYSLYLPASFALRSAGHYLELVLGHVPPVPDTLSTLSVDLNGIGLAVIPLTAENAELTPIRFDLAGAFFEVGRNRLEVTLDTGERCGIAGARADVAIWATSFFHLEYELEPYPSDLALYPLPFYEASFDPQMVYFVLPDKPSANDLSAMATISAGLGNLSEGEVLLRAVCVGQLTPEIQDQHHLIVVVKKGSNDLLDQLSLPLRLNEDSVSETQGVIEELASPWNPLRMILVVSGLSDEGVAKASAALNRENHFLGMRGPVSVVEAVEAPPAPEDRGREVDLTLASLGYEEEVFCGTMPNAVEFRFYMPLGWVMMEEPRLVLSFAHSQVIDPSTSSLDVQLNGVPVGSVLLDDSNATDGLLEVELPAWQIEPGRNRIRVSVEMNLAREDKCLFMENCHLWTVVHSNSYIHLPYTSEEVRPSLDMFPYPFTDIPDLDGMLLVLPDDPPTRDVDGMLRVAAMLGAAARGEYLAVDAVTASEVTEAMRQERHLIVLGRPTANSLIQELNEALPQPFEDGTDLLRPRLDSVVFAPDAKRQAGLVQELASPWNAQKTVLVLTGTGDEGVSLAYETLLTRSQELAGSVAVTEELTGTIHTYETRTPGSVQEPQTVEKVDMDSALLSQLGEWWW
jgi:hypothetical protein